MKFEICPHCKRVQNPNVDFCCSECGCIKKTTPKKYQQAMWTVKNVTESNRVRKERQEIKEMLASAKEKLGPQQINIFNDEGRKKI